MIDWLNVLSNLLWILGLAELLATLSLAHWLAGLQGRSLRWGLAEPRFRLAIAAGFLLFGLDLTLAVEPWWYKIGWVGVIALSVWEGVAAWRAWPVETGRS